MRRFSTLVMIVMTLLIGGDALAQAKVRAQAQPVAPGTIKGRIFDEESGESMPYTNVYISGSNIGTMAFTDGFYIMRGLQPGTYTVKASYISYGLGEKTVTLHAGEVINLDFHLEVHAILAEPLVIGAERALIEVERTGSAHFLTSKTMEAMALDSVVDMIAMQPGVTMQDNEIHIRGGRADDTMFVVDGMSVNDPLAGGGYGYNIDPSIINEIEVLTGGFSAEYGQAVSGVVNVTTKEGNDRLSGNFSFKRDYFGHRTPKNDFMDWRDFTTFEEPHNIDIIKGSLSGPDPISAGLRAIGINLPGTQFVLASVSVDMRDGYLPIYSRQNKLQSPIYKKDFWASRQQNNWNGLLKWTWNLTPRHKLNFNMTRNVNIGQGFRVPGEGYPQPFMDNLDQYLVFTNENILTQLYYRQVLSESSWFEVTLGRNWSRQHSNVNGNDDYTTYSSRNGDNLSGSLSPARQFSGSADRWHDHYVEAYTLKGSYSFMSTQMNKFKTGFEVSLTEMQLIDLKGRLGDPEPGTLAASQDIFAATPITSAAYFQDTIEYRGLIVNAGLRVDFWAPGKEVQLVMDNPDDYLFIDDRMAAAFDSKTFDAFGYAWKSRISPRLGLSFPVTPQDKFFFNYGHFNQWPRFAYVYPQLTATTAADIPLLGNPDLDPKVTIEYETGLQHEFDGLWSLGVTFFNRDIYDYAKSVSIDAVVIGAEDTPDPDDTGSADVSPVRYFNGDSARSIGVELSVIKRTIRWLSGSASVEFQRTTGTNSDADQGFLDARFGNEDDAISIGGLTRNPLIWDKPWTASFNADFSVFDSDRPVIFGWRTPANWSFNILARFEAGQRYTPSLEFVQSGSDGGRTIRGDQYSAIGPYQSTINVKLNKFWRSPNGQKFSIFIEARNLFNHVNYRRVNPWTGEGYKLGDYNPNWTASNQGVIVDGEPFDGSTDSEEYAKSVVNPSYIVNPRVVMWGVSYSW